jgi:hypothetical protein
MERGAGARALISAPAQTLGRAVCYPLLSRRDRPAVSSAQPSTKEPLMRAKPTSPLVAVLALASAALAVAAAYEPPRVFKAQELLTAAQIKGPHHTVAPEVKTDGYFCEFEIRSDYGAMAAEGKSLLLARLNEIRALGELDKVSKSEVFVKAAGQSLANVGKGVVATAENPEATAKGIGKGLKRFGTNLGRSAKGAAEDATDSQKKEGEPEKSGGEKAAGAAESTGKSVLGVSKSYRRWAQKVGVDPYTSNELLRKRLDEIAEVDAAGAVATKVVVPIPPVVSTTAGVGNLVWGKDPQELAKLNEQRLKELGVADAVAKRFLGNKNLSPTDQTRIVAALYAVKAKGSAAYVDAASRTKIEREALFFAEGPEMMQRVNAKAKVVEILPDSRALVGKLADGRAVVFLPVDWIGWTQAFEQAAREVAARARAELGATKLELRMSGRMSDVAKQEMASLGWTVVEDVPLTFETAKPAAQK